jgi:hypothetical protein
MNITSNFDHEIDYDVVDSLMTGEIESADFPAHEFFATVTYLDGDFSARIQRYGSHVDTISATTIEELQTLVNDKWGWD